MGKNREARDHPCIDGQTIFNKIIWLSHLMQWSKGQSFQQMGWGKPDLPKQKSEPGILLFITYKK